MSKGLKMIHKIVNTKKGRGYTSMVNEMVHKFECGTRPMLAQGMQIKDIKVTVTFKGISRKRLKRKYKIEDMLREMQKPIDPTPPLYMPSFKNAPKFNPETDGIGTDVQYYLGTEDEDDEDDEDDTGNDPADESTSISAAAVQNGVSDSSHHVHFEELDIDTPVVYDDVNPTNAQDVHDPLDDLAKSTDCLTGTPGNLSGIMSMVLNECLEEFEVAASSSMITADDQNTMWALIKELNATAEAGYLGGLNDLNKLNHLLAMADIPLYISIVYSSKPDGLSLVPVKKLATLIKFDIDSIAPYDPVTTFEIYPDPRNKYNVAAAAKKLVDALTFTEFSSDEMGVAFPYIRACEKIGEYLQTVVKSMIVHDSFMCFLDETVSHRRIITTLNSIIWRLQTTAEYVKTADPISTHVALKVLRNICETLRIPINMISRDNGVMITNNHEIYDQYQHYERYLQKRLHDLKESEDTSGLMYSVVRVKDFLKSVCCDQVNGEYVINNIPEMMIAGEYLQLRRVQNINIPGSLIDSIPDLNGEAIDMCNLRGFVGIKLEDAMNNYYFMDWLKTIISLINMSSDPDVETEYNDTNPRIMVAFSKGINIERSTVCLYSCRYDSFKEYPTAEIWRMLKLLQDGSPSQASAEAIYQHLTNLLKYQSVIHHVYSPDINNIEDQVAKAQMVHNIAKTFFPALDLGK